MHRAPVSTPDTEPVSAIPVESVVAPSTARPGRGARAGIQDLWQSLRYPVHRRALPGVVVCAILLGILDFVTSASEFVGLLTFLAGWGGLLVWSIRLLRENAQGMAHRIQWQDPVDVWHELLDPLARSTVAILASLLPALALAGFGPAAALVGIALSCATLPVALGSLALGAMLVRFDAGAGVRRIQHRPYAYAHVVLLTLALVCVLLALNALVGEFVVGRAVVRVMLVPAVVILARAHGLFLQMTRGVVGSGRNQDDY